MEKAIIRIEEEIKALRIEIQSVWEITLDSVTLSILRAKLSGLEQALVICNEVNDFVEPTRNQKKWIKNARVLSTDESDDVILNIIGSIKDYDNQNTLIDYIEGVTVWEKLELEFTCKEFLMEIGFK
jgi:hypothetical protein